MQDEITPDVPLTGEEAGVGDAPLADTPQVEGADAEQQPQEPEFKYELATGQRYRDEQELVKAQEHATRHIYELNQRVAAYEAALQATRQPQQPAPDPYEGHIQKVAEALYNEGGIAWDTAVAMAKVQVQQVAPIQEALQTFTRQQMTSEYESIRSQDPAFDFNTENPQHRAILGMISEAYPSEGPRQHYARFAAMTGRDPAKGAQVRQTVEAQIAQRQRGFGQPANGAAPAPAQDSPKVQGAVDMYLRLQQANGRDITKIPAAEIESVKTRARAMSGNR